MSITILFLCFLKNKVRLLVFSFIQNNHSNCLHSSEDIENKVNETLSRKYIILSLL